MRGVGRIRLPDGGTASLLLLCLLWLGTAVLLAGALVVQPSRPLGLAALGLLLLMAPATLLALAARRARAGDTPEAPAVVMRDELTSLYAGRYFFERVEDEMQRAGRYGRSFSILLIDIDGLRALNAVYGEAGGDQVLRLLGYALRVQVRASDIAARLDDDGFAMLLPETGEAEATGIAERLVRGAARLGGVAGRLGFPVSLSYGVATYQIETRGSEELLRVAERALSLMKREKRRQAWRPQS